MDDLLDRCMEARAVTHKLKTISPAERKLEGILIRHWAGQRRALITKMSRLRSRFSEAELSDELERTFVVVVGAAAVRLRRKVAPVLELVHVTASSTALTDVSVPSHAAASAVFAKTRAGELVTGLNETTKIRLRSLMTNAVEGGWSYQRTADEISQRFAGFESSRAHVVAVTEINGAYEAGRWGQAQALAKAGISLEKRWLDVGDAREDDHCRSNAAAGWIAFGKTFPAGGERAPAHPMCRCFTDVRIKRGSADKAA